MSNTNKRALKWFWAFVSTVGVIAAGLSGLAARRSVEIGQWPLVAKRGVTLSEKLGNTRPQVADSSNAGAEAEYFYTVADLLQHDYVDPVKVDDKMAEGAIKGMVNSLIDPASRFYDEKTLPAYKQRMAGVYADTGLLVNLDFDEATLKKYRAKMQIDSLSLLPDIHVADVVPGSVADKAGFQPGDVILKINEKFVISGADVRKLRQLQEDVTTKKVDNTELKTFQTLLQTRAKVSMSAIRAREVLTTPLSGPLTVISVRDGVERTSVMNPATVTIKPLDEDASGIHLNFIDGASGALRAHGLKSGDTIDLRHSGDGESAEMFKCLDEIVPMGVFGSLVAERGKSPLTNLQTPIFKVNNLKLEVDGTTRGAAAVFAEALVAKGIGALDGVPSDDNRVVDFFPVDATTGYTLSTGTYSAEGVK